MGQVEDKRTAILEATLRLIAKNGFHGTAMSKVAKEAGVSAGIIYHYFDSKDDLIDELYKTVKRRSAEAMLRDFDASQPLPAQIRHIWENAFRYYLRNLEDAVFMGQYVASPFYRGEIAEEVRQYSEPIFACLDQAREEGLLKDLPPLFTTTLVVDVAGSLAQKQAAGLIELTDGVVDRIIDALFEAVMA
jgi:AcrR family transcriptional regulator